MATPVSVPFFPFPTIEYLTQEGASTASDEWPLTAFCTWGLQVPELSEAPVRQVMCNRQGVHEFILLSCEVLTATDNVVTLWLRIERRPLNQGVGVLLNKSKPAHDTVKASTNLPALRPPCDSRDSFTYSPHENPHEVLRFKHIAEMCRYFTGHSLEYSLLGANCRWICFALLECLRESHPCYGGTWIPSQNQRTAADVRAAQVAKSHYLRDKHPNSKATAGLASIAMANSSQNTHNRGSQYVAGQNVIYRTPRSLPESAVPRRDPSTLTGNVGGNFGASTRPQRPSAGGAPANNMASSSSTGLPLASSVAQPNRQQNDVSPLPAGANVAQQPQSPSVSEDLA
ncbi:hypothetical protein FRC11_000814 [Ceratobasidium sp. 423]|nr:hypothetical protein FRC11_000814 [Ceratobasidium sp. 423]